MEANSFFAQLIAVFIKKKSNGKKFLLIKNGLPKTDHILSLSHTFASQTALVEIYNEPSNTVILTIPVYF